MYPFIQATEEEAEPDLEDAAPITQNGQEEEEDDFGARMRSAALAKRQRMGDEPKRQQPKEVHESPLGCYESEVA